MQAPELEPDFSVSLVPARARRALALIFASLVAIAATAVAYVHPTLALFDHPAAVLPAANAPYQVAAVDFVDPATGWVVVDFASGDFAILHTFDGGLSWTRELSGAGQGHPRYLRFFDVAVGVFALIGTAPQLYRTADGGKTWATIPVPKVKGLALSWSFVDSDFGWLLVSGTSAASPLPAYLYRTEDGGFSWTNLGTPVSAAEQAFEINFSYFTTGWLTSANDGPFAYKTIDFGSTWTRVPLPQPWNGWPQGGKFVVAVQPTSGLGAVASVVFVPILHGRKGAGAMIQDFPPLTVRAFDGGRPVTYTYSTAVGMKNNGPIPQAQAPNQTELSTTDNGATWRPISPPAGGALGYFDATNWWWVGAGMRSSSHDGGATWTDPKTTAVVEPVPGTLQVVDPVHAWFAGVDPSRPALEATSDGGVHWRLVRLPPLPDLATS